MTFQKNNRPKFGRSAFGSDRRRPTTRSRGPKKENIHPTRFIQPAIISAEDIYKPKNAFSDFFVDSLLKRNIEKKGFQNPSPIQDQTIPLALEGRDVIGLANTGTGKTLAFAIPIIHRLLSDPRAHALIMAPTRELAEQIFLEMRTLSQGGNIPWALLIGGTPMRQQFKDLSHRPRMVVGTPGRIKDHIERETLRLNFFNHIVLDEVDRMLDMGFVEDMRDILSRSSKERQSFFFSATLDDKARNLINEFSKNPVTISVTKGKTSENIHQNIVKYVSRQEKIEKLHQLLIEKRDEKILIFDETKRGVDALSKELQDRGFYAEATHGDKTQGQRQRVLAKFRSGYIKILVATDVAARGIDVADITHVINYSTPQSYSDYIHRIGRAGRAGRVGYALTFVENFR
ncbi:MAG: DEAD/DEAH box helicase [Candidatus Moraniibacteriota bacterium]|nr:MAG: DEAD/DEAH box helicase [Candidatus Moranbacteria bacterium]